MAKGERITASRFNAIRATTVGIMGVGSGQTGYGQAVVSTSAVPGQAISSTVFNNLRTDMAKAYAHQVNAAVVNSPASVLANQNPPNLELITVSTQVSEDILTQYENFVNNPSTGISARKAVAAPAQLDTTLITGTNRSTAWGGTSQVQTLSHTVTLTFNGYTQSTLTVAAADHIRCFFNAGGTINFNASRSGGTVSNKNTTWTSMLSGIGTMIFGATAFSISGSVNAGGTVSSSVGFFSLTIGAAATTLLIQPGPAGVYAENDYIVQVSRPTANTLAFTITFRDDDVGDQTGIGAPVDEVVDGNLSSAISVTRPAGANVDVPYPTGVSVPASL